MSGSVIVPVALAVCVALVRSSSHSPSIVSRGEWGARGPTEPARALRINPAPYVLIHHSASPSCTNQALCNERVRSIQTSHISERHWSDIGYNFLIGEDGNVYEGRGWNKHGAHSRDYNGKSIGICFIGNFAGHTPAPAAIRVAKQLIEWAAETGRLTSDYKILAHRQTASTQCPGDSLYDLIKSWPHWSDRSAH